MTYRQIADVAVATMPAQSDPRVALTKVTTAVAIAYAESGGHPGAVNAGSCARGLWQAMPLHGFGLASCDPHSAAAEMWSLSAGGTSWRPWTTYGGARYLAALPFARQAAIGAIAGVASGAAGQAIQGLHPFNTSAGFLNAITELPKAILWIIQWFFSGGALRVAEVFAGGVLVLVGIFVLLWHSKAGQEVRSVAPAALAAA